MESAYGYKLLLMFLIIGINAFFAAAETALVSARPSRLRQLADRGIVGASAALSLLANPERLLSVGQVGVTLTSLALGWVGEDTLYALFQSLFGSVMTPALAPVLRVLVLILSFALMTFLHVVIGEVVPKNLAIERADRFAILVAPALLVFYKLAEPFVWVIERTSAYLSRLIGVRGGAHGVHSVEELKFIISASHSAGHLTQFEQQALDRLLELRDYVVREIMVPRNKLAMIPAGSDLDDVLKVFSESHYSRLLVYEKSEENILGVIHVKDVLDFWAYRRLATLKRRSVPPFDLKRILRKTPVVPETKPLDQVIDEFRSNHAHLAIVVDEYGSLAGLLTLEDVIEQVFGEIEDEFDPQAARPLAASEEISVEGTISLVDLESQYGIEVPTKGEYETLAGFLMFELGHIPTAGERVDCGIRIYEVLEMKNNRVELVRIRRKPPTEAPAAEAPLSTD
jgi:CBS domain containing-hemolysin-like protein